MCVRCVIGLSLPCAGLCGLVTCMNTTTVQYAHIVDVDRHYCFTIANNLNKLSTQQQQTNSTCVSQCCCAATEAVFAYEAKKPLRTGVRTGLLITLSVCLPVCLNICRCYVKYSWFLLIARAVRGQFPQTRDL